jgi:CRP/FNR family transcriptional regulator
MINHKDYNFFKKHTTFLKHLSATKRCLWFDHISNAAYRQGQSIRCKNEGETGMILLKNGSLRVFVLTKDGREVTLYRLCEGELCVLSIDFSERFNTLYLQIEAESDCEVLMIDAVSFDFLCEASIYAKEYFSRLLNEKLFTTMLSMERALFTTLEKRLAFFLLHEPSSVKDVLEVTHEQIAHHIGCTREPVTRALDCFVRDGFVKLNRGSINILNHVGLESILAIE